MPKTAATIAPHKPMPGYRYLDPAEPLVAQLIGMIEARCKDGWTVRADDLLMDARELRIVLRNAAGLEKWMSIGSLRLMRAKNVDTYLNYAIEQELGRLKLLKD